MRRVVVVHLNPSILSFSGGDSVSHRVRGYARAGNGEILTTRNRPPDAAEGDNVATMSSDTRPVTTRTSERGAATRGALLEAAKQVCRQLVSPRRA